ncbi:unnamed protein product [Anisakis simplex]|uniref:Hexosyltransferase n=1 Tax=Anisakis simplex TaxID=6269 RepID=A0A0M3IY39_ANISI|nr:unnamed protein product [Anisakis simplex]
MLFGTRAWRRYNRYIKAFITLLISTVVVLWYIGMLDHLRERPFAHFKWPPFVNVRYQVALEEAGLQATRLYENDWAYIQPKTLPKCSGNSKELAQSKNFILIIVKSSAQNLDHRNAIRSTWGAINETMGYRIRTVFLVAMLDSEYQRKMGDVLSKEANYYGDLLIGDFLDAYRNNTLKARPFIVQHVIADSFLNQIVIYRIPCCNVFFSIFFQFLTAVQLAFTYCSHAQSIVPFAVLIDDDYFLSIENLIIEIRRHSSNDHLYMGWRFDTRPFRLRFFKHALSIAAYPYDRFPPYITAGAVLLSRRTIRQFYYAIQHIRLFNFDDIYAGIVAHLMRITPQHNSRMLFWGIDSPVEMSFNDLICAHGFTPARLHEAYRRLKLHKS